VEDQATRSAVGAVRLNGGWIRRASSRPILDADLHLNPPNAGLSGELSSTLDAGVAPFRMMWIERRGVGYKLHFACDVADGLTLGTENTIEVDESAEFEIRAANYESGDNFGFSVDIDDDYLVVGMPAKHKPVTEVQTIRTEGLVAESKVVFEVQVVGTQLDHVPEIQTFETSAEPDYGINGTFRLSLGDKWTRRIESDATAAAVAQYLMEDIPEVGVVAVTRRENTYCECFNAFNWTLTFVTLQVRGWA
jgi:hypothetical protein